LLALRKALLLGGRGCSGAVETVTFLPVVVWDAVHEQHGRSWPAETPGFLVLDFYHHQPLRRHRWPGFGAIPQFEQAIDIVWL
jgi:hypothetical protein